jgi:hypothetical protein
MEKQPEMPKSPEQILAEKKEKLAKAIDLMLDWQKSKKIKEALLPQLDNLTSEEIDYCLKQVRYLDNQVQLRGPLPTTASEALIEDEAKLNEMEEIIGSERAKELKSLME